MKAYEVAIIGLGAMGSAAAYHLARRGVSVIGFDRFEPPHREGSSHGESRIIREAYFEHPLYVPLVQRAYECWHQLESEADTTLLLQTGGLMLGSKEGGLIGGTRFSADRHGLDYEMLSAREIRKRFPVFEPNDKVAGFYEKRAGVLLPERCVEAHLELAARHGSELHYNEPVFEWDAQGKGVRLTTELADYRASRVVLTLGPWMGDFLSELALPLTLERQVLHWFDPVDKVDAYAIGRLPIYAWEYDRDSLLYGLPFVGEGAKIALHHQGQIADLESLSQHVDEVEVAGMRMLIDAMIPSLNGPLLRSEVCVYTNTPDGHFVIDNHPLSPELLVISACSGHGFKFSSVVGEIAADLLVDGKSRFDLSPFSIARLMEDTG